MYQCPKYVYVDNLSVECQRYKHATPVLSYIFFRFGRLDKVGAAMDVNQTECFIKTCQTQSWTGVKCVEKKSNSLDSFASINPAGLISETEGFPFSVQIQLENNLQHKCRWQMSLIQWDCAAPYEWMICFCASSIFKETYWYDVICFTIFTMSVVLTSMSIGKASSSGVRCRVI